MFPKDSTGSMIGKEHALGLNTSLKGKKYPSATYEVTAEAIRKYAQATNEDNPVFNSDSPLTPPAFPIVPAGNGIANALFDQELGVNLPMLVHGEEEHLFRLPIQAGDVLTVESSLEDVSQKETGETFTVYTALTNQR